MDDITLLSYRGRSGLRPTANGLRLAVCSFLIFISVLMGSTAWASASHRLLAVEDSAFGVLPISLGKPQECHFADGRALNGGSYADGLMVVGGATCPTDQGSAEHIPYYWQDSSWVQASLSDDTFYDGYIAAVSDDPAEPTMLYAMRQSDGDDATPDELALLVGEAGQAQVKLEPLADMRLVLGTGAISAGGNVVVGHSAAGDDPDAGYTYRAVRWSRTEAGWSEPEDIGEGRAVATNADGRIVVGNGDGYDWGATGGKAWVWVADDDGGGVVTALGADARVSDIAHSGSMIIGSRPEPCSGEWCDFYPVPTYWVQDGGQWVMHDLPTVAGADARAVAVAEIDGQAVILGEWVSFDPFTIRAGVWLPDENGAYGPPLMLETIGANPETIAFAFDINREGIVLGWSELKPWDEGTTVLWSLKETLPFQINPGISDAWYNPDSDGQGFLVMVWEEIGTMFAGWFTYGADSAEGKNYWMTAQGPYQENTGELAVTVSQNGAFDSPQPAPQKTPDGTLTITYSSCLEGTVTYDIPSIGRQGTIPIRRLTHDQVYQCESMAVPGTR